MNQQKGFSLIEVLASLLLVTTLALSLLQQQWQSRQLLNQLIWREQSSQLLDQVDEAILTHANKPPALPLPYLAQIKQNHQETLVRLSRRDTGIVLIRHHINAAIYQ